MNLVRARISENQVHRAFVEFWNFAGRRDVKLIHVPNELADTDAKRIRQSKLGMWVGCPDIIMVPPAGEPVGFVELKASGRYVARTGTQADARAWVETAGHRWAFVNNPDDIAPLLMRWGLVRNIVAGAA
jgi:hypothetical protein